MEKGVHDSKSKREQVIVADTERSNDLIQKGLEKYWVPDLFLEHKHRSILCTGQPLDDTIIEASQRLLCRQFPQFKGLQPTLYSQALHKFQEHPEGSDSIQIHHTGTFHWVTSTTIGRPRCAMARIMDSKSAGNRVPNCSYLFL